ncbi:hypothetical protein ACL9RL_07085 [Plantibacter sp. Mn2098]|uniref:hypothetical protein n=1 Tax=Plantibacter sp. Mn2098 TaxID=3395266 RepID=UPI003BD2A5FC
MKAPDSYLHGEEGPVVIVPARVAAYLKQRIKLDELRLNARDMRDVEVYHVLNSLHRAALSYRAGSSTIISAETVERPTMLTTRQAATQLQLTPRGVRDACEKGRLDGELVDGRWQISRASIQHYKNQ